MAGSSSSSIHIYPEKFSPPTTPGPRVKSPFALRRRSRTRTLGRVAILLIALVVCGMGVNEWLCEEHGCLTRTDWLPNMDETRVRNGNFIGGGSVIGKYHWSEEEYESSRLEHMTQAEKEAFWSQQNGEVLVVEGEDKGGQFQGSDSKAEGMGEQDSGDVMAEGGDAVLVEMDDAEPLEETEQPPNYTDTMQNGDKQVEDDSNVQVEAISAGEEMPMLGEMEMGVF